VVYFGEADDTGACSEIEAGGAEYALAEVAGGRVEAHTI